MSVYEHLIERHMQPESYTSFVDERERVASFMLYDLSGRLTGFQQYRPDADKTKSNHPRESRYFTYATKGKTPVFGMETFDWTNHLFIVEGIFDAVRLHNYGHSAIALLSNNTKSLRNWLWMLNRPIFAVCDGGETGKHLIKFSHKAFACDGESDLGDMSEKEVQEIIAFFC